MHRKRDFEDAEIVRDYRYQMLVTGTGQIYGGISMNVDLTDKQTQHFWSYVRRLLLGIVLTFALLTSTVVQPVQLAQAATRTAPAYAACRGTSKVIRYWWGVEAWLDSCATEETIRQHEAGKWAALAACSQPNTPPVKFVCGVFAGYHNLPYVGFLSRMKRAYEQSYQRRGVILSQPWLGPGYWSPQ
jgi:hypothetical protein